MTLRIALTDCMNPNDACHGILALQEAAINYELVQTTKGWSIDIYTEEGDQTELRTITELHHYIEDHE